jgi:hypothetical protein
MTRGAQPSVLPPWWRGLSRSWSVPWQGDDADTEKLRTTLKDLRSLWQRLDGFSHQA